MSRPSSETFLSVTASMAFGLKPSCMPTAADERDLQDTLLAHKELYQKFDTMMPAFVKRAHIESLSQEAGSIGNPTEAYYSNLVTLADFDAEVTARQLSAKKLVDLMAMGDALPPCLEYYPRRYQ